MPVNFSEFGSRMSRAGSAIKSTAVKSTRTLKADQQILSLQRELLDAYRLLGILTYEARGELSEEELALLCRKIEENEAEIRRLRLEIAEMNGRPQETVNAEAVQVRFETAWGRETADLLLREEIRKDRTPVAKRAIGAIRDGYRSIMHQGENVEPLRLEEKEDTILDIDIRDRTVVDDGSPRVLLKDVRLSIHKGEMVLILGGSGAGKTTFFNAVMGSEKANAVILYNNIDFYQNFDRLKHMIGYVPQEDPLRMDDTVWETLKNAAELRLPESEVGDAKKLDKRLHEVLTMMNLDKESDNIVSKLSGGQRKRLSIATEYIVNPSIFFLDEPDSGLDGNQARIVMNKMREIADAGRMVMVISHSPDRVAELFDKVIVLAKSNADDCGRLAFFGTPSEALSFFGAETIEGIVAKIDAEGSRADEYIGRFEEMRTAEDHPTIGG